MPDLILPPNLAREQQVEEQIGRAKWFDRLLKEMDEDLSLVMVPENADYPGLLPGRWHVRRRSWISGPHATDTYIPIAGPNGEYIEPHSGVLEELKQRDMWREPVSQQILREKQQQEAADRKRDLENEQKKDIFAEDFRAARRVAGETLHKRSWGKR